MDLRDKDKEFTILFQDYLLHILEEFDNIRPFQHCMVDVGEDALAFVGSHDRSISGYSKIGHLITGEKDGNMRSKIVTAKNKIGKRTVVIYELLCLVLAVGHSCAVLRLLPIDALSTITKILFPGDSTIISTFLIPE